MKTSNLILTWLTRAHAAALVATLATGCDSESSKNIVLDYETLDSPEATDSWEEFKAASAFRAPDGSFGYIVEGDLPINTEEELREYYDELISGQSEKGVVHRHNSADDIWLNGNQRFLRYCIDNSFGATGDTISYAGMVAAMTTATRAWEAVANIRYVYDSARDGTCKLGDAIPTGDTRYFKISRYVGLEAGLSACAFGPQSRSAWTCAGQDGNTIGVRPTAPNTLAPMMMHELGHALGLHHEFFHSSGGGCSTTSVRNVTTSADLVSIMGYPQNVGACQKTTPGNALSLLDGWTVRTFYGAPPVWMLVL
jgi:hypothetical protein